MTKEYPKTPLSGTKLKNSSIQIIRQTTHETYYYNYLGPDPWVVKKNNEPQNQEL
jgi:hypothetical protein